LSQIYNHCHCVKTGLVFFLLVLGPLSASAQFEDFRIRVGDTVVNAACIDTVPIHIYIQNWTDIVAGFDFILLLDRPDIMGFQTTPDTIVDSSYWRCLEWDDEVCLDSMDITDSILMEPSYNYDWISITRHPVWSANIDTTGTLCSGWEYIRCTTPDPNGHLLRFSARSSYYGPPFTGGIGYPPTGDIPLIRIWADVYDIPEEQPDRTVNIFIQQECLDFGFEDPCKFFYDENGLPIGWEFITDTLIDTTCFNCDLWNETGDTCYFWSQIEESYGDSCYCCDTILTGHIDSSNVAIYSGTLTVATGCFPGDINADGMVNLIDIVDLINYLYKGGPKPPCLESADILYDGVINLLDVIELIHILYPH